MISCPTSTHPVLVPSGHGIPERVGPQTELGYPQSADQGAPSTHTEPMLETADRGDQTAWDREHLSKGGHSEHEVNAQRPIAPGRR